MQVSRPFPSLPCKVLCFAERSAECYVEALYRCKVMQIGHFLQREGGSAALAEVVWCRVFFSQHARKHSVGILTPAMERSEARIALKMGQQTA